MGNFITSCNANRKTAVKLIDFHGNRRLIDAVGITAAEIMLEQPGRLISPIVNLRRVFRLSVLRADEELLPGKIYVLIPANRVNTMVSASELEVLKSGGRRRRSSSKVLPAAVMESEDSGDLFGRVEIVTGRSGYQCKQWKPVLEPIDEGI